MNNKSCLFCDSGIQLSKHHIIYKSFGGSKDDLNTVCLCWDCHSHLHESSERIQFVLYRYICFLKNIDPDTAFLSLNSMKHFKRQKDLLLDKVNCLQSELKVYSGVKIYKLKPAMRKKARRIKSQISRYNKRILKIDHKIAELMLTKEKSPI